MFEFDKYDARRHAASPVLPPADLPPPVGVEKLAFLMWGEHCVECAAPACFATCDLYDPRQDRRCRRFVYGVFPNRKFATIRGPAAELVFKKWGKIEARANLQMWPRRRLAAVEAMVPPLSRWLDGVGGAASRLLGRLELAAASYALIERLTQMLRRFDQGDRPDGFLIELFNPHDQAVTCSSACQSMVGGRPGPSRSMNFPGRSSAG